MITRLNAICFIDILIIFDVQRWIVIMKETCFFDGDQLKVVNEFILSNYFKIQLSYKLSIILVSSINEQINENFPFITYFPAAVSLHCNRPITGIRRIASASDD